MSRALRDGLLPRRCTARLAIVALTFCVVAIAAGARAEAAPSRVQLGSFCGQRGAGAGQCKTVRGIAVNFTGAGEVESGSVYVIDAGNRRVQQFSAAGAFVRAFGLEVDESTGGNICSADSGDICKAGTASAAAGSLNEPYGVAVDQATGAVYVSSERNRRVDVFSATGNFEGAIGWNVDASSPAEELQFCTAATGCAAGVAGAAAGQFGKLEVSGLAVDPRSGDLYVADAGNSRIAEYGVTADGEGQVTGANFVRALGWEVDAAAPAGEPQVCTTLTGCRKGASGGGAGQFLKFNPGPIAVDSAGNIYAANVSYGPNCLPAQPCSVLKFNPDGTFKEGFGAATGECQLTYTTGTPRNVEAFAVAVDPVLADQDNRVYLAKKTAAGEYRVYEFAEDGRSCTPSPAAGLDALPGTSLENVGLSLGIGGRVYVNSAASTGGEVVLLGEGPAPAAAFGEATDVGGEGARVTGAVTPPDELGGRTFDTVWHFEYSTDQAHWTSSPVPDRDAGSVPGVAVPVETTLTGLSPSTTYFVRLCATTGPTVCEPSPALEFTTEAIGPTVAPFSAEVTQTEATLGAEINPNSLATRYRFEWAAQSEWERSPGAYGHRVPDRDREIGAGKGTVHVGERLGGLAPAGLLHFRVVATNSAGTTMSPDQQVETLDSCGLTDGRCFELVSRADKGPLASPGKTPLRSNLQFQAAPGGSALVYAVESGYPDATANEELVYVAHRDVAGWSSEQITPSFLGPPTTADAGGTNAMVRSVSPDLGCAVVASVGDLAAGAPPTVVEAGGANLYRRGEDGSYTTITALPPVNASEVLGSVDANSYRVIGTSSDCGRVVFSTPYRYPGIPAVASSASQLYEWDHGTLRNVAVIPGPGGASEPVPAESIPGAMDRAPSNGVPLGKKGQTNYWRAVSEDGARSIFTAISRFGGDSGRRAVFLRDTDSPAVRDGTAPAIDISQSETATPNDGNSRFWTASVDGRRVFFTARYGLASGGSSGGATACANASLGDAKESSGEGCDLYEYDLGKPAGERLTDLSVDSTDPTGAGVAGVLDTSEDGRYVYFAARGQLGAVGGTEAENLRSGSYNVYLAHAGTFHLVGSLAQVDAIDGSTGTALINTFGGGAGWTSHATDDGSALAFESSAGAVDGVPAVYLYSAVTGKTVCVSCRHDGQAPFAEHALLSALIGPQTTNAASQSVRPTVLTENGRLYFYSFDPLATGAVEGRRNLYQWEHGQVSLIATEPAGVQMNGIVKTPSANFFGGTDAAGEDVYLTSPLPLTGSDQDERWAVYDARVGGGFRESAAPVPCDAFVEGACNSAPANPPAPTGAATSHFTGPGNSPVAGSRHKHKRKRKHRSGHTRTRKHHQKGKGKKHKKAEAGNARRGNRDRRAAK